MGEDKNLRGFSPPRMTWTAWSMNIWIARIQDCYIKKTPHESNKSNLEVLCTNDVQVDKHREKLLMIKNGRHLLTWDGLDLLLWAEEAKSDSHWQNNLWIVQACWHDHHRPSSLAQTQPGSSKLVGKTRNVKFRWCRHNQDCPRLLSWTSLGLVSHYGSCNFTGNGWSWRLGLDRWHCQSDAKFQRNFGEENLCSRLMAVWSRSLILENVDKGMTSNPKATTRQALQDCAKSIVQVDT